MKNTLLWRKSSFSAPPNLASHTVVFGGLVLHPTQGAIHSTKISGNFGLKLNGSVRSNRKSFEKTGPPFKVYHFSRSDRLEFWLNGSRPQCPSFFVCNAYHRQASLRSRSVYFI